MPSSFLQPIPSRLDETFQRQPLSFLYAQPSPRLEGAHPGMNHLCRTSRKPPASSETTEFSKARGL